MIRIYTDGAAQGNPGPGGYGVVMKFKDAVKEISEGFRLTTNNRMELLAVISGLEAIKKNGIPVTIYSDSKYVVDSVEKGWIWGWEKKNFAKKANADLWQRYIKLHHKYNPKFVWIKGHAGHPENERCDRLAVYAAESSDLQVDSWYEETGWIKKYSARYTTVNICQTTVAIRESIMMNFSADLKSRCH